MNSLWPSPWLLVKGSGSLWLWWWSLRASLSSPPGFWKPCYQEILTSGTGFWKTSRNATHTISPLSLVLILSVTLKEIKKNLLVYNTLAHQSPPRKIFEFLPSIFLARSLCLSMRRKVELTFYVNTKGLRLCALLIKVFSDSMSRYVLYILFFSRPLSAFLQHYYSSAQLMLLSKI